MDDFVSQVGGKERLRSIVADFYDRVLEDPLIGFMFSESAIERIIDRQTQYLMKHLGDGTANYEGEPIREAHQDLPITSGHADRRHQLLEETLQDWEMPSSARREWLELDESLRDLVVRTGEQKRNEMTDGNGGDVS